MERSGGPGMPGPYRFVLLTHQSRRGEACLARTAVVGGPTPTKAITFSATRPIFVGEGHVPPVGLFITNACSLSSPVHLHGIRGVSVPGRHLDKCVRKAPATRVLTSQVTAFQRE